MARRYAVPSRLPGWGEYTIVNVEVIVCQMYRAEEAQYKYFSTRMPGPALEGLSFFLCLVPAISRRLGIYIYTSASPDCGR